MTALLILGLALGSSPDADAQAALALAKAARERTPAAPEVAVKPTFRSGPVFNASHNCPACGRSQYVISGGAKGGRHTHTCRYDGTVWYH